jgi:hypothetical protein
VTPSAAARLATRVPAGLVRAGAAIAAGALVTSGLTLSGAQAQPSGPRAAEEAGPRAPLGVSIETLTPSTMPRSGNVTVTGEIRNRSESTWTDLQVFLVLGSTPMTTSAELEEATATAETTDVGARITSPGLYDDVEDLEPGETTSYTLSVPRRVLPDAGHGVYWLSVHVLGTNEEGRIDGADGRARTFYASMPAGAPRTNLSVVVPLRAAVRRTPDGRLANLGAWNRRLAEDGRLSRLVDLVGNASEPVTWVVDPAVLEAARSVSDGNPPFDLAPTDEEVPEGSPSPDSPLTESPGTVEEGEDGEADPSEEVSELAEESQRAAEWLGDFEQTASEQTLLTLPYGDVDVGSLLRGDFADTYDRATELSVQLMDELGLDATPAVAPADGLFPNLALERLDPGTMLLLSERAADVEATTIRLRQGSEAVLASEVARTGGPSPTPPYNALALRQRILGEVAVHGLASEQPRPLVVTLPEQWDPGANYASSSFFEGLEVPWIRQIDVPFAQAISRPVGYDEQLTYSRAVRRREIPDANILAAQELNGAGSLLADLLTRNDTIDEQVGRAAMLGASTNARLRPHRALVSTRQMSEQVHARLGQVYVESSTLVTMSSETGNFSVTVVNGLEEPVTVGIAAETGTDELAIRPPDLVSLGPGQRASVRLAVSTTGTGVHSVRITPTTRDGRPLGQSTRVKVRTSQVGLVIWLIIGTGAAVFVAAIAARIRRRVRARTVASEDTPDAAAQQTQQEDTVS